MQTKRFYAEKNGDIYCNLFIDTPAALRRLQHELIRLKFTHSQVLEMPSLNDSLSEIGVSLTLEYILVIINKQRLFQYAVHPITAPTAAPFLANDKIVIHSDYIEIFPEADTKPPYASFEILA